MDVQSLFQRIGRKHVFVLVFLVIVLGAGGWIFTWHKAPMAVADTELFVVGKNDAPEDIASKLQERGFIKYPFASALYQRVGKITAENIEPGGYEIAQNMNLFRVFDVLNESPRKVWVTIPEGLRVEEIAARFAKSLGWTEDDVNKFITVDTALTYERIEGFYFPDTYLVNRDESTYNIAQIMLQRFETVFAPYYPKFLEANIKNDTAVRLASIVQREAAGKDDMPLVAGVAWNRLLSGIKLEMDSTVQYARGDIGQGYWAPITAADIREIDSPYNTYKVEGLPPHAICNPGLDAIDAVLNPEKTDCLFFLHDNEKQIHCAVTREEHEANIEKYLR